VLQRRGTGRPKLLRNPAVAGLLLALLFGSSLVVAGGMSPTEQGPGGSAGDASGTDNSGDSSSYEDSGGDYSYDYSGDYSYDYGDDYSERTSDLIGTWSGPVTDSADSSGEESVTVTVNTFDGIADGTLETQLDNRHCSYELAWIKAEGATEIFEASDPDGCPTRRVRLHNSSDVTVRYLEEWVEDGQTFSYSGLLRRG
jgi:hypothetical protein